MATLGGCQLAEHDTDSDSSDHKVRPGQWREATCAESEAARSGRELSVWSSLTDTEGTFGEALIFTSWGTRDGRLPVVADVRYMEEGKTCRHMVYEVTA